MNNNNNFSKPSNCDKREEEFINIEKGENNKIPVDPEDKFYVINISFFLLGLVHILPWTFFTTATEFWMYKFRNTTINETNSEFRTDLQAQFNSSVKATMQVSNMVFLIIALLFGHYITVRVRKIGILLVILVMFVVITAFVKVDTDSWQTGLFALTLVITAVINAMNATLTITMYTVIAFFPHSYLASYVMGGGLAAVTSSTLQIISLSFALPTQDSALVYFSTGLLVIVFTLVTLVVTGQNKFYLYHMDRIPQKHNEKIISLNEAGRLLKKIWSPVTIIGFYYLGMDGSPTALVVSEGEGNGSWNDTFFIPTITYFLSAICSLLGRGLAFRFRLKLSSAGWSILALMKVIIFVPLIILCNAQPRSQIPVLLPHDYQYIIIITIFNLCGGYLLGIGYYNIASLVKKEELKSAYHIYMLLAGLQMALMSFLSILIVDLL